MNSKVLLLLLGASCGAFFSNEAVYGASNFWGGDLFPKPLEPSAKTAGLKTKPGGIQTSDAAVSTQAVAIACRNPKQDFFGFDPRNAQAMANFQREMSALGQQGRASSDLLKDWINHLGTAVGLTGFLNSFGETLALADPQGVATTLAKGQSVNPLNVLNKAYADMARLISGQVVKIDEKRTATAGEARVMLQAAANLGRKKAIELGDPSLYEGGFEGLVVDELLAEYNLLNPRALNKTTLRHNTILLRRSLSAALVGTSSYAIDAILRKKGFDAALLGEANAYLGGRNFLSIQPSRHLEAIIAGRYETYDSEPTPAKLAEAAFKGINTLGIELSYIYVRFAPYGKPAFDALRAPRAFIDGVRAESEGHIPSPAKRGRFNSMLDGIQQALADPAYIHNIPGFGYGSVFAGRLVSAPEQERLTKQTWLNAAHDFVTIYFYAQKEGCLEEFYHDATPPEDAPCLPGKIRTSQEWFESKTTLVNDIPGILEKLFAGQAGIELQSAVQQLYKKHVWGAAEIYRAEKVGISAEAAKKQREFKTEYLTLKAVKEGLADMVLGSLPGVIEKYRMNRSVHFPIPAFHSYKYGDIALEDALAAGNGRLTTQQIMERQAQANQAIIRQVLLMVDTLQARGEIEIFNPPSAASVLGRGGY